MEMGAGVTVIAETPGTHVPLAWSLLARCPLRLVLSAEPVCPTSRGHARGLGRGQSRARVLTRGPGGPSAGPARCPLHGDQPHEELRAQRVPFWALIPGKCCAHAWGCGVRAPSLYLKVVALPFSKAEAPGGAGRKLFRE